MQEQFNKINMSVRTLFVILFASVCAGCFGMEEMVGASGPGLTLLMILLVPVFWAAPIALLCAELGAALPEQGGYYVWCKRALGPFWAYQAGYWRTWLWYINVGVLIVLAMEYIGSFLTMDRWLYFLFVLVIIVAIGYVNIRGLEAVSWLSVVFLIIIMVPFGLLVIMGIPQMQFNPIEPFFNPANSTTGNISFAIVLGVWMYGAFEGPASYAGEVNNFSKIFPKALALTVISMTLTYFLPMLVGLAAVGQWELWGTGGEGGISVVELCQEIGGPALGIAMLVSACFSNIIMSNDNMTATTRIPFAMAKDNLLPKAFARLHPKYKTPTFSIVFTCAVALIISMSGGFAILVEFQTFVFFATYIMAIAAVIALRIKEPDLPRPYKIPLGTKGLVAYCIPVLAICAYSIIGCGFTAMIGAAIFITTGPITYLIFKKMYGGIEKNESDSIVDESKE